MKKVFLAAAAFVAMSVSSYGATIQGSCGTNLYNSVGTLTDGTAPYQGPAPSPLVNDGGSASRNCVGFNVLGATLNSVTLFYNVDYAFSDQFSSPALSYSITFNPDNGLFNNDPVTVTRTGNGVNKNPLSTPNTATALNIVPGVTTTFNPFSVLLSVGSISGGASGFSGTIFYQYDYSFAQTGVPEPSSMILMGSALLGIAGLLRRRR